MKRLFHFALTTILLMLAVLPTVGKDVMRYRRFTVENGLIQNYVTSITQDAQGYIWIGSRSGLCRFDGKEFKSYSVTKDGKKIGWIRKVVVDRDGRTLLMKINNQKFVSFNPETRELKQLLKPVTLKNQNPPKEVLDYDEQGLVMHHKGEEYRIPYSRTMPMERPHSENYQDRQGNLWVNFENALYEISFAPQDFHIYNKVGDAAGTDFRSDVRSFLRLKDGTMLVSTKDKLVVRYSRDGRFMAFLDANGHWQQQRAECIESVYRMVQDAKGRVWMGMRVAGMACLDNIDTPQQTLHAWRTAYGSALRSDNIFDLYLNTKANRIWMATWDHGFSLLELNSMPTLQNFFAALSTPQGQDMTQVRRICAMGDTIGVCTTTGVYLYDNQGQPIDRYGDFDVSAIARIGGKMYIGAYSQGVFVVDEKGKEKQLCPIDIPNLADCIYGMTTYGDSVLVFANPDRLVLYDIKRGNVRYYDDEGLGINASFAESALLVEGDTLYAGLDCGILKLPLRHKSSTLKDTNLVFDDLRTSLGMGETVSIKPALLDYRIPRSISYAWREKGESQWHYLEAGNGEVQMSWLLPGTHTVEFCSTDATGAWLGNITEVQFSVSPNWWQWIIIIVVLALAAIVAALVWKVNHPKLIVSSDTAVDTAEDIFPSAPDVTPFDRQLAQQLVECIEAHISETDFGVEQLAKEMGMSRSQLYTQCNETLDRTPAAFIQEIRMKRAMQLLETRQFRINEVAYKVGFTDPKYFAKTFKKRVGMSPRQYQDKE